MTVNLNQCRVLLLVTPEQFEQLLQAARDGQAITVEGEEAPPSRPGVVKTLPLAPSLRRVG